MEQEARVPCPYCKELILPGALKCKECGSNLRRQAGPAGTWIWARNLPNRKILGVAACLAANFRVSATLVRLVFVLLTFVSFLGLLIYLLLACVIPADPGGRSLFEAVVDAVGAALDNLRTRPPQDHVNGEAAPTPPPVPAAPPVSPQPPDVTVQA